MLRLLADPANVPYAASSTDLARIDSAWHNWGRSLWQGHLIDALDAYAPLSAPLLWADSQITAISNATLDAYFRCLKEGGILGVEVTPTAVLFDFSSACTLPILTHLTASPLTPPPLPLLMSLTFDTLKQDHPDINRLLNLSITSPYYIVGVTGYFTDRCAYRCAFACNLLSPAQWERLARKSSFLDVSVRALLQNLVIETSHISVEGRKWEYWTGNLVGHIGNAYGLLDYTGNFHT